MAIFFPQQVNGDLILTIVIIFKFMSDNLKDLLRFLRRDDPHTRDVFKQVCKWNIVSKDLIPIIEHCQDDRNLVLNAGRFSYLSNIYCERELKDEFLLLLLLFV